jgi:hypothetical protein
VPRCKTVGAKIEGAGPPGSREHAHTCLTLDIALQLA